MDILRFITAGNVDDGKSTLIGRLLYESSNLKEDVLRSVYKEQSINLAHITDGLRQEREHKITIDVAYKYFTTDIRKYIVIDAPGHFQYTKNLVTGASGADVMIILIDVRNGITEQTKRHLLTASFLKTKNIVIAVNKMDVVGYDEQQFGQLKLQCDLLIGQLGLSGVAYIPVSALYGNNILRMSNKMSWYTGPTLMKYLESCDTITSTTGPVTRFNIQYSAHVEENVAHFGKLYSGKMSLGDEVCAYPDGRCATITKIVQGYTEVNTALEGNNLVVFLSDNTILRRGTLLAKPDKPLFSADVFSVSICWLSPSCDLSNEYYVRINGQLAECRISQVFSKIDIDDLKQQSKHVSLNMNDFVKAELRTLCPLAFDKSDLLQVTGRGILIEKGTGNVCAAFTVD